MSFQNLSEEKNDPSEEKQREENQNRSAENENNQQIQKTNYPKVPPQRWGEDKAGMFY